MTNKKQILLEKYRQELLQCNLPEKHRLESIRQLAAKFRCSPGTAAAVMQDLVAEGLVYPVPGKGYFFHKKSLPRKKIGYLGQAPAPFIDTTVNEALIALMDHLESSKDVDIIHIQYRALQNIESGKKLLHNLDGLLLHASFLDNKSLLILRTFNKPIVVFGAFFHENRLICNQVMADFSTALKEFCQCCDLNKYSRIVLMQTQTRNSAATAQQLIDYFNMIGVTSRVIIQETRALTGYGNVIFGHTLASSFTEDDIKNSLFILLSDHISCGVYSYIEENGLSPEMLPDILSVDNYEGHDPELQRNAFFTTIDRSIKECYIHAADLLFSELKTPSNRRVILQIPTKLIIRKSIRNIKKGNYS